MEKDSLIMKEGESPPTEVEYMRIAQRWIDDPFGTRTEMVAQILGPEDPDLPTPPARLVEAMRTATLSHASTLAWVRGEKKTCVEGLYECTSCTEFMEETFKQKMPAPILNPSVWFGKDLGWRCLVCAGEQDFRGCRPADPILPPEFKEPMN